MRPREDYINILNHELNLDLSSFRIITNFDWTYLKHITTQAVKDGYRFEFTDGEYYEICKDKDFRNLLHKIIEVKTISKLRAEREKENDYESARVLKVNQNKVVKKIFSEKKISTVNEKFFTKKDESTIEVKSFSNPDFQSYFLFIVFEYQIIKTRLKVA